MMGVQGEEGRRGVVAFPVLVLPTDACDLSSSLLTGLKVRFWAHITALPLRARRGSIRFAKRLSACGCNTPLARAVNRCRCWARLLSSGVLRLPLSPARCSRIALCRAAFCLVSMTLLEWNERVRLRSLLVQSGLCSGMERSVMRLPFVLC